MNNALLSKPDEFERFGEEVTDILEVDYIPNMGLSSYGFSAAPNYGLRLSGKVIAGLSVAFDVDGMNNSDVELYLYKTVKDRFVCQRITAKDEEGAAPKVDWQVVENETSIKAFFGQGWIAQELYLMANIDNTELIASGVGKNLGDQYEEVIVRRDGKPSLRFFGKSLAFLTYNHEYDYDYEETLELFIMPNGKYVCKSEQIGVHKGELDHFYGKVCKDYKAIREFFKYKQGSDEAVSWVGSLSKISRK